MSVSLVQWGFLLVLFVVSLSALFVRRTFKGSLADKLRLAMAEGQRAERLRCAETDLWLLKPWQRRVGLVWWRRALRFARWWRFILGFFLPELRRAIGKVWREVRYAFELPISIYLLAAAGVALLVDFIWGIAIVDEVAVPWARATPWFQQGRAEYDALMSGVIVVPWVAADARHVLIEGIEAIADAADVGMHAAQLGIDRDDVLAVVPGDSDDGVEFFPVLLKDLTFRGDALQDRVELVGLLGCRLFDGLVGHGGIVLLGMRIAKKCCLPF
jgi:hypothetical protein